MSNSQSSIVTRIVLLRHGITQGESCFRGSTDFALTRTGLEQMRAATADLKGIEHVISSPLGRCRDFAAEYSKTNSIDLTINDDFREIDFGDWDGKDKQAVWNEDQTQLSAFWRDPWKSPPPNGEAMQTFDERVQSGWKRTLDEHQGKTLLVVTHGGVIKQLLRSVLEMPKNTAHLQRLNIPFAAVVPLSIYRDEKGHLWPELLWSGFRDTTQFCRL
nr:histidine phosphatase family protein [Vibrio sp. 10N.286.48.B7]PMH77714.1 hypothetical protein BCU58_12070 [Vibrio sp. 10N.286.48.B7]